MYQTTKNEKENYNYLFVIYLSFFIGKTAYDSFMLNSYYSHGDELIAKIEKYNMERHTYPLSLDSIGIKGYDLGGGLIYKNLSLDTPV